MKYLILTRGSVGCGKSTWIKNNNLERYVISPDNLRLMVQSPITNIEGKLEVSNKNDKFVWDLLKDLLEKRMERGEFTIIDATHARSQFINSTYKKLCSEYGYRCFIVDFSNVPIEVAKQRNAQRLEHQIVPEHVVDRMYAQLEEQDASNWCTIIKPEEFFDYFPKVLNKLDYSKYNKIHVLGDIHGCYDPLKEYFDKHDIDNDNELFIFTGDYVDRGIQNKEVLEFLISIKDKKNVLLLEGNHEIWVKYYANEQEEKIRSREFSNYTIPQIKNVDKKQLRQLCRKFAQLAWFKYNDFDFCVTHAGIPKLPSPYMATIEYTKGAGKYEDYIIVENSWDKNTLENQFQIHGHRNTENNEIQTGDSRNFNLCDTVEFGGNLRILQIGKDDDGSVFGKREFIKNNTFFIGQKEEDVINVKTEKIDLEVLVNLLRKNSFIKETKINENISSFNFTRKAFYNKEWNDQTVKSRGLFINHNNKTIVARGYEKFFNESEGSDLKLDSLRRTLIFPVDAYLKYNGFLGIVGYDKQSDQLIVASKSSNQTQFAKWFKNILKKKINLDILKEYTRDNNVGLIFEVIDGINDPHIIDYGSEQDVVLLDIINLDIEYQNKNYKELELFAKQNNLNYKKLCYTFNDYNQLYEFIKDFKGNYDYKLNDEYIEGFVLVDKSNFMFKLKSEYYSIWKRFRGVRDNMLRNRPVDTRSFVKPLEIRILAFMQRLERQDLEKSLFEIRSMFEKEKGL